MTVAWREWGGVPVDEDRRNKWADQIAAGECFSCASGDSMVFGEIDTTDGERTIEITDAEIRRVARVPLIPGCPADKFEKLRFASGALADALEALVERLDGDRNFVNPDGGAEMLNAARLALRAAGRLP